MALTAGLPRMQDLPLAGKRVLIRSDLNVPLKDGRVADDTRIRAALPTYRAALEQGAAVGVLSHLGRPKEGKPDPDASLAPVAAHLSALLEREVPLVENWLDDPQLEPGQLKLMENVRFNTGEKGDAPELARRMAAICEIFVMDAFGTAHRAQASTHGIARFAPQACGGPLLCAELDALDAALEDPRRPMVAIVGGAKVSGKLEVLQSLLGRVDRLIVGGGIANTFLAAAGHPIGRSLHEPELIDTARRLLEQARDTGKDIPLPRTVVVTREFSAEAEAREVPVDAVGDDDMILDLGAGFARGLAGPLAAAGTIVWNGPLGVFEFPACAGGTEQLAHAIADSAAFSIAGGGDTLAAIARFGVADRISYISTGGGAFLEVLEGRTLPGVAVLVGAG